MARADLSNTQVDGLPEEAFVVQFSIVLLCANTLAQPTKVFSVQSSVAYDVAFTHSILCASCDAMSSFWVTFVLPSRSRQSWLCAEKFTF